MLLAFYKTYINTWQLACVLLHWPTEFNKNDDPPPCFYTYTGYSAKSITIQLSIEAMRNLHDFCFHLRLPVFGNVINRVSCADVFSCSLF